MAELPQDNSDELEALLSELDSEETSILEQKLLEPILESEPIEPILEPEPIKSTQEPEPIKSTQEPEPEPKQTEDKIEIDLQDLYNNSLHELRDNYRCDRKEIDKFIKLLYEKLKKDQPSRVIFEALSTAFRTKSEANSNLVKLIENVGKKLDKKNDSSSIDDIDLDMLLDE